LANLELSQLLNHPGPDEKRDHQRRQRGKRSAKREVAEDSERVKKRKQLFVKKPVKQVASTAGLRLGFRMILQGGGVAGTAGRRKAADRQPNTLSS
jgi:hypothetical protein